MTSSSTTTRKPRPSYDYPVVVKSAMLALLRDGVYPTCEKVYVAMGGGTPATVARTIRSLVASGAVRITVPKGHRRAGNNSGTGPRVEGHEARILAHQCRVQSEIGREREGEKTTNRRKDRRHAE